MIEGDESDDLGIIVENLCDSIPQLYPQLRALASPEGMPLLSPWLPSMTNLAFVG